MLPAKFNLDHLDDEIRELVININRIPGVYTNTTCEGHVWEECPAWPAKDGWTHFNVPSGSHEGLIPHLNQFFFAHPYFDLTYYENTTPSLQDRPIHYMITANHPQHRIDGEDIFSRLPEELQRDYFEFCHEWKRRKINPGWRRLNELILDYIRKNVTEDVESLQYIEEGEALKPFMMCRC
jgi:hypothetical protein